MALGKVQAVGARPAGKSALENAYKAFDLATTLAGLFGKTPEIPGTNTPNWGFFNQASSNAVPTIPGSTDYMSKFYLTK